MKSNNMIVNDEQTLSNAEHDTPQDLTSMMGPNPIMSPNSVSQRPLGDPYNTEMQIRDESNNVLMENMKTEVTNYDRPNIPKPSRLSQKQYRMGTEKRKSMTDCQGPILKARKTAQSLNNFNQSKTNTRRNLSAIYRGQKQDFDQFLKTQHSAVMPRGIHTS